MFLWCMGKIPDLEFNVPSDTRSIRAERGFTTSVVILGGRDSGTNMILANQMAITDDILLNMPVWPDGLAINGVQLPTKTHLKDMLNVFRAQARALTVTFHNVLDFYSDITETFMLWLLVNLPMTMLTL